jgi:molecular chaperone GrpE (heat shock protein)
MGKKKNPEYMQAAYKLQKLAATEVLPATEMQRVFSRVAEPLKSADDCPILAGIAETLAIKCDSLREAVRDFRDEIAAVSSAFAQEKQNAEDFFAQAQAIAARFTQQAVLHEAATFEEILTHSVPRITQAAAADALRAASLELETILRKNNIETIRPQPHDAFNAKEHEVLVAEVCENFDKGTIIKVISTGYRGGGKVAIRANVVAAK